MVRKLKIYETANNRRDPCILLGGKWVKDLGYRIGGYITITAEADRIVIEKCPETYQHKEFRHFA